MFIAFEGIDGSGKSTVARRVAAYLKDQGRDVYYTFEPTDNDIGQLLDDLRQHDFAEAMLFMADRAKHITEMREHLDAGRIVIVDRYYMSTCAYQGATLASYFGSMQEALEWLLGCHRPFIMQPDMTFILRIAPEISLQRINTRDSITKFEKSEFLQMVSENYQTLSEIEDNVITINAAQPLEKVVDDVLSFFVENAKGL